MQVSRAVGGKLVLFEANMREFKSVDSDLKIEKLQMYKLQVYTLLKQSLQAYEIEVLGGQKVYVSCYQYHNDLYKLKINSLFSKKLGMNHGDSVVISEYENPVVSANEVHVEPLTSDDWEIIELNSEMVQNELLNQLRIVWVGMVFPFWVHATTCVFFKVYKLVPDSKLCLLETQAAVIVSPYNGKTTRSVSSSFVEQSEMSPSIFERSMSVDDTTRSSSSSFQPSKLVRCPSLQDVFSKQTISEVDYPKSYDDELKSDFDLDKRIWGAIKRFIVPHSSQLTDFPYLFKSDRKFDQNFGDSVDLVLKVMPVNPKLKFQYSTRSRCFNYVYISEETLKNEVVQPIEEPMSFVAVLKTLMNRKQRYVQGVRELDKRKGKDKDEIFISQSLIVRVIIVPEEISKKYPHNFIMCSIVLRQQLGLKSGSLVRLSSLATNPANVDTLVLYPLSPLKAKSDAVTAAFHVSILQSHECNQPQLFSPGSIVEISINDENPKCIFVVDIKGPIGKIGQDPLYSYLSQCSELEIKVESAKATPSHLRFPHKELKDLNEVNLATLGDRVANERVIERAQTSKELLKDIQKRQLTFLGHCIRKEKLECVALQGRIEGKRARGRQRIKFIDTTKTALESTGKRSESMKNLLIQHYCEAADCHPCILLLEDIELLFPSDGEQSSETKNYAEKMDGRREILETLMMNNAKVDVSSINDIDMDLFSERTEGFVASDLQTIIDRAIHSASCRMAASSQV
ncbi:Peroxisome biogenesis factor 1 [Nymphon striatum]|nr:Peroxisome biogenesis factor 1 [Nymphon striatum]